MKQLILIFSIFLSSFGIVEAQEQRPFGGPAQREQKIQALYVAFISKELKLTEEEAKRFWPVHTQFDSEMRATHQNMPTDQLKREQALLDIKKKYQDKFSNILGSDRTNTFFRADMEFRKKLVERLKNMRENKGKNRSLMNRD